MSNLFFLMLIALELAAQQTQTARILTLKEAEQIALRNHPRIREAQYQVDAAGALVQQARSAQLPSFNAVVTATGAQEHTVLGAGTLQDSSLSTRGAAGFALNQLVTDFGRTARLTESRRTDVRSIEENVKFNRAQVLLGVQETYYQALLAQSVLKAAEKNLEMRKVTQRQVQKLAESNLKSSLDVSFAEVNASQGELLVVRAENNLGAALSRLSAAMGLSAAENFTLTSEGESNPPDPESVPLVKRALDSRPDLSTLRLRQEAASQFADSEARLRLPTISAVGATGLIPVGEKRLPSTYGGAGVNVSIPILNGRLFVNRQREAASRAQAAGEQARDLEIRIANSVRIAWLNTQTAWKRVSVTRTLVEQARRSLRLAQVRYDLGLGSIVELSQAQLNNTDAEIEGSSATYQYQIELARLRFEAGDLR